MEVIVDCLETSTVISVYNQQNLSRSDSTEKASSAIWLKNEMYELKELDGDILSSASSLLNNNLTDAGQKLICTILDSLDSYPSVLNCQKKKSTYLPVSGDHIQLLLDGSCHCFLSFSSSGRVQLCDSLRTNLISVSKRCLNLFNSCS